MWFCQAVSGGERWCCLRKDWAQFTRIPHNRQHQINTWAGYEATERGEGAGGVTPARRRASEGKGAVGRQHERADNGTTKHTATRRCEVAIYIVRAKVELNVGDAHELIHICLRKTKTYVVHVMISQFTSIKGGNG
jgi:hypothetical protein